MPISGGCSTNMGVSAERWLHLPRVLQPRHELALGSAATSAGSRGLGAEKATGAEKGPGKGTICCPRAAWEAFQTKFYSNPDYASTPHSAADLLDLHRKAFDDGDWSSRGDERLWASL